MIAVTLTTSDGLDLEARWDLPAAPSGYVVFCHPHPLFGGTMTAPLMQGVTSRLVDAGMAVLRFNFRGVAASEGRHDFGIAEQLDVQAAVDLAESTYPQLSLRIAGWSFGAATALAWQATSGNASPYGGIAPPTDFDRAPELPLPDRLNGADRVFILGDRDQFTTVDELRTYADCIGAALEVIKGSDHFFHFREDRVAEILARRFT